MNINRSEIPFPVSLVSKWSPRTMFFVDSMGAILTATTIGIVLPYFNDYLGVEIGHLHFLAIYVLVLFAYSFSVFLIKPTKWVILLKIIALANFSYCVITLKLVYQHFEDLTMLAVIYFIVESLLIMGIAVVEWRYSEYFSSREIIN
ncbi:hypothetical protein [Algoriphagus marincola]|uniref:hypothetical protein n=1 Tax=Algoriphagus marincola TaxID=264027 RepID=UPI000478707D|nr:hypothetical protein [Algoriphagus marincola]